MLPASWDRLQARVIVTLDAFHTERPDVPGIGLEQLRRGDKALLPPPLFLAAIKRLAEAGQVVLDRMWVRRPYHQVRFSEEEEKIWALVRSRLAREPFRPPRVRDIATAMHIDETFVRRLLRMAARRGDADEIAHDHFFLRSVVQSMAEIAIDVAAHAPEGRFTAAQFRDRLDNGRKVAIQILEFFDRHGFTIRRQDMRRINPARIELFAPTAGQAKRRSPAPGGATGLQIRVGPSDGLRWVRLPSSSANTLPESLIFRTGDNSQNSRALSLFLFMRVHRDPRTRRHTAAAPSPMGTSCHLFLPALRGSDGSAGRKANAGPIASVATKANVEKIR